jgi:hypothetical protein
MRIYSSLRIIPLLAATLAGLSAADDDWVAIGQNATVQKNGPTTTLDYKVAPGQMGMAVLQVGDGKLAGMTHLRFRVKTDVSTMLAVMLSEKKPGGDYTTIFWAPKGQWQDIDLTPADFMVNDGTKDPKDPDGKLDLDQVQAIALLDAGQLFGQMPADKTPIAIVKLSGDHKLEWSDYGVVTEAGKTDQGAVIDDFRRGFLRWFTPGGDLALSKSGNPLGKPALEFRYQQEATKIAALLHPLGQIDLTGRKELSFDISSSRDAHLILALEKQKVNGRGPRYNHDFTVAAGQTGHMSIPFSEFTLADDSPPDPAGRLELNQIRSLNLVDISGMLEGSTGPNTLWIAEVKVQ